MSKEKITLNKKGIISNFQIVGEAKVNDYTYKIDEKSDNSSWIYNSLNLGVDCGENGIVYSEMMGGYFSDGDNVIYAHGKDDEGKDNFDDKVVVDWEDRTNEKYLENIGDMCFITVGLEKKENDKTFYKKFLSAYDAIAYIKEHLKNGMVVNIKGNIKYQFYKGNVSVKKEITSIVLSSAEKSKYRASFTQTLLIDKDSIGKLDKEKGIIPIYARVIDYVGKYNGKPIKLYLPFNKTFEFAVNTEDPEKIKKVINLIFKVKKDVTEITFEGKFYEGATIINATVDDLTDDLKEMVELGLMSEEEALSKCVVSTNREKRMILIKPYFKPIKKEGEVPQMSKIENRYKEEDLVFDFDTIFGDNEDEIAEEVVNSTTKEKAVDSANDDDDTAWLEELGI